MINYFNTYLQNLGKQANLQIYQYSQTTPLILNGTNTNILFVSSREVLDDINNNCKYAEKIIFNNTGGNFAVSIGYNPAQNFQSSIDKTNCLIADYLNNLNYDGYYLFNMFPDVSSKKIKKQASVCPNYIDIVLDFLINYNMNNCDIYIFWGSSVYMSTSIISKLSNLQNVCHSLKTIGVVSHPHKHPGRGVASRTIASFLANLNPLVNGSSHYLK